ncbi:MAG: sterol desaturase family protein [Acidobacteriota bacterium]|nr:sterol desaturase family protein [Acidobacteriota bacterium]
MAHQKSHGFAIFGFAALLFALELRRALRKTRHESKIVRDARNLAIAAGAGLAMQIAERPLSTRLARHVYRRGWGVTPLLAKSGAAQTAIGIVLLDYGLYLWHVLTHKVPLLWRFHLVHHIDLDLDASTALRFHFGEMLLSVPWRLAQIAVVGPSPRSLSIWQTSLLASILFHHSNVRLPKRAERALSFLIVTPRMHGIHHEALRENTDSNWSSGLTIWDLVHGTYRWHAESAPIGVPAYMNRDDVTLPNCVTIPFRRQRDDWVT